MDDTTDMTSRTSPGDHPRTTSLTSTLPGSSSDRARWTALYVLCAGVLMIVLDTTVVNVALPSIQDDLRFSTAGLAWVVNAYLIAFGGLLLLAGRLGDLLGRRRVFLGGLALFTAASIACGAASAPAVLVIARFAQGIGGAMTSAVVLGMIVTMFPERGEQARAIGVYAFVASAGGAVGLVAGGALTALSWHWIFMINVPIGLATWLGAARLLPADRGPGMRSGADFPGALLVTGSLMLAVYTIVGPGAEQGWTAPTSIGLGLLALLLLAAFVGRQATATRPLMPLRIFRSRNVSGANAIQVASVAGIFGMFFLGTLYLERILGYGPLQIGLAFLPTTVLMGLLSVRYTERIVTRVGARPAVIAGLVLIALALALFARAPLAGSYLVDVLPATILFGIGGGVCFPALMTLAMSGATPEDAGLASGLVNTTAQVGGALGLAVLATLSATRATGLSGVTSVEAAMLSGFHLAFGVGAGFVVVAVLIAVTVLRPATTPVEAVPAGPGPTPGDEPVAACAE